MDKLRKIFVVALICLVLSTTALAGYWQLSNIVTVTTGNVTVVLSTPLTNVPINTNITLTAILNYLGTTPSGKTIQFESSPDGSDWTVEGANTTDSAGKAFWTHNMTLTSIQFRAGFFVS